MQLIWTFGFLYGRIFYRCNPVTRNSANSVTVPFTQIIQIFPGVSIGTAFFKIKGA